MDVSLCNMSVCVGMSVIKSSSHIRVRRQGMDPGSEVDRPDTKADTCGVAGTVFTDFA